MASGSKAYVHCEKKLLTFVSGQERRENDGNGVNSLRTLEGIRKTPLKVLMNHF